MSVSMNKLASLKKVATGNQSLKILRTISTKISDDYQYIERSKLPSMHFQKSLPRLPIPEIDKTCERYLNAQQPILTSEEFAKTSKYVNTFKNGVGKELNQELISQDKRNKHTSYISEPWFDMYLSARVSNVLNFNPFVGFALDPNSQYNDQIIRATNMLVSSLRFHRSLKENLLSPQVFHLDPSKSDNDFFKKFTRFLPSAIACYGAYLLKGFPLDMSQFKNLFSSTKIPCLGRDRLLSDPNSKHMLVIRNGNYYVFDALDENGDIHSPEHLLACLKYIKSDTRPKSENAIGIMTADNRDKWASVRKYLLQLGNEEHFKMVDTALFALVLEDEDLSKDEVNFVHQMLHGNADNRWFDKSFQLILDKSGSASINFEHSWGDGVAILRYFEEVFKDSTQNHFVHPDTSPANVEVEKLVRNIEFNIDDKVKNNLNEAYSGYKELVGPLRVTPIRYEGLSKKLIKSKKLSPDSVIQLAFQMAHYKLHGYLPAHYESCSTAAFKHGRTETIRPCNMTTKKFTEAVCRTDRSSNQELMSLLVQCSKIHSQLVRDAAMGQGFDRHLFGLRLIAEKNGAVPDIFTDPSYSYANNYVLSTSTMNSDALSGAAFAPVVPNGFGLGYGFWKDITGAAMTYFEGHQDGEAYKSALIDSFNDLAKILSSK